MPKYPWIWYYWSYTKADWSPFDEWNCTIYCRAVLQNTDILKRSNSHRKGHTLVIAAIDQQLESHPSTAGDWSCSWIGLCRDWKALEAWKGTGKVHVDERFGNKIIRYKRDDSRLLGKSNSSGKEISAFVLVLALCCRRDRWSLYQIILTKPILRFLQDKYSGLKAIEQHWERFAAHNVYFSQSWMRHSPGKERNFGVLRLDCNLLNNFQNMCYFSLILTPLLFAVAQQPSRTCRAGLAGGKPLLQCIRKRCYLGKLGWLWST